MGSDKHYPEEAPAHRVTVDGFWIGRTPAYDMIGNVWEWTSDWWSSKHEVDSSKPYCAPKNPGGSEQESYDPQQPEIKIPRKVIKGSSHLSRRITAAVTGQRHAMRNQ